MSLRRPLLALALAALLLPSAAFAQDDEPDRDEDRPRFDRRDRDRDDDRPRKDGEREDRDGPRHRPDDARPPMGPGGGGGAAITIADGILYVLSGGTLYKVDAESMEILAKVQLVERPAHDGPRHRPQADEGDEDEDRRPARKRRPRDEDEAGDDWKPRHEDRDEPKGR